MEFLRVLFNLHFDESGEAETGAGCAAVNRLVGYVMSLALTRKEFSMRCFFAEIPW